MQTPWSFCSRLPGAIAENDEAAVNISTTNTKASLNNKRQTNDDAFAEDNPLVINESSLLNNHNHIGYYTFC